MWSLAACLVMPLAVVGADSPNVLLRDLTEQGVRLDSTAVRKLPPPMMRDNLAAAEEQAALKQAAGKYPLDRFLRDSPVSPFSLQIDPVSSAAGQRIGQEIHFSCVAYGSLDKASQGDIINEILSADTENAEARNDLVRQLLSSDELRERNIAPLSADDRYYAIQSTILKKVRLNATIRQTRAATPSSVILCTMLDDRFANDKKYPNRWYPADKSPADKLPVDKLPVDKGISESKAGERSQPYAGLGAFTKITSLKEPAGALFIEFHAVLAEPHDWFQGANLLGSKLPVAVQNYVRDLRRTLKK